MALRTSSAVFGMCCLTLVLSACTQTPSANTSNTVNMAQPSSPELSPLAGLNWADGTAVQAYSVALSSASEIPRNQLFTPVESAPKISDKQANFVELGLNDQGDFLAAKTEAAGVNTDTWELSGHSRVGLFEDGDSFSAFSSTRNTINKDGNRQAVFGTVRSDEYVWVETTSTDLIASNWRIFSASSKDAKSRLVARSEDVWDSSELPLTSGEPAPVIGGDMVYWASTTEGTGTQWGSDILKKRVDGTGQLQVVAHKAVSPAVISTGVALLGLTPDKFAAEDLDPRLPGVPTEVRVIKSDASEQVLLSKSPTAKTDSAFSPMIGEENTLMTDFGSDTLVIDVEQKTIHSFSAPPGFGSSGQRICGDYATWTYLSPDGESNDQQYFFNVKSQQLQSIKVKDLYGETQCNGDYFAWSILDRSNKDALAHYEVLKFK